jgi:tripartite-type tricarboxylate transporter receptor subunit TctC
MNKRHFINTCALLALGLSALTTHAQEFPPKKTITMVVGFAAGGAADTAARIIAKKLGDNIGASVVIDNRGGAGGNIAHQFAANGPTDGSTILFGSVGPLTIAPHMMKLPYDPVKDLSPITMGVNFPKCWWCIRAQASKPLQSTSRTPRKTQTNLTTRPQDQALPHTLLVNCSTTWRASTPCTYRTKAAPPLCKTC